MNRRPLVSVIVTTFNRLDLLKRALGSVRRQSLKDWEIIVADAGSQDGSLAYLERVKPTVRLARLSGNPGLSALMNAGLAAARGRFVAFLESDDRWSRGYLSAMTAGFKDPRIQCVSSEWWVATPQGQAVKRFRWRDTALLNPDVLGYERMDSGPRFHWGWHLSFSMFRRSVFRRVGPLDPCLRWAGIDVDLYARITLAFGAAGFLRLEKPLGLWTRHFSSPQLSEMVYNVAVSTRAPGPTRKDLESHRKEIQADGAYLAWKNAARWPKIESLLSERKRVRKHFLSLN